MKQKLYSVRDTKSGYLTPMHFPNDEIAQRGYKVMKQEDKFLQIAPEDFELWYIGTFDTDTGIIENTEEKRRLE